MPICDCGTYIKNHYDLNEHLKTKKHLIQKEKQRLLEKGLYKAKIYKIVNNVDDKIYIGSTIQPLHKRMADHKKLYKSKSKYQCSSSILFECNGIDNCQICLIEEIEIHNTEEQRKCEREWYDKLKDVAVNKQNPFTSKDEKKLYNTKWSGSRGEYICDCGSNIKVREKPIHNKTIKHQTYINNLKIANDNKPTII